ncbi:MAG: exodeoxyribonuclease V subunit gamma, partial [Melioribacteraceae bacterium]|nr:exodeoxyribonuclease V subunit gamma [Melioribacteraceae bacterium]
DIFKNKVNNRIDELELIAKTIKLLLVNNRIDPANICVAFNNIGNYSNTARDVFTKFGIPFNLSDRLPLKSSQPVIAAISLLELAENDFNYNELLKVLTNGFLVIENIDLNNIINVANELKITRGLQNWESSIKDATSLLSFKKEITNEEKSIIQSNYDKAKIDIGNIAELLSPLKRKNTKNEFLHLFKKLLLQLKLPYTVLEQSQPKEEEFIKAITVLLQTLEEVLFLIDSGEENKKFSLQYYLDHIRTISNWARFNIKEKSDYGVLITSVNEIRGLKYDHLFLGGMCDGDFPTKYSPEIFFSGSFQKKEQLHQTEERFHFYQALCSWNKKLYLTIPKNNAESELVESTFIKDIEKLFEFSELDIELRNNVLTKEELQILFASKKQNNQLKDELNQFGLNASDLVAKCKVREERKSKTFHDYEFAGFINNGDQEIQDYLTEFGKKQFSISQLETFAKCPFKYFSERVLKLSPIEEPTEEAEPIELGNVLHSILYEFYTIVKEKKIAISARGTKEFEKLKNLIFSIAEDKINKLNLNSPIAFFEKEKILGIEGVRENSILYKFLSEESNHADDFIPTFFENSFGKFSNDTENQSEPFMIGELKLRGKIDRIDVNEEDSSFNIIDYKLKGRKPTGNDLAEGISLQLPVYLMAGRQILEKASAKKFRTNKMIIYSLDYKSDNFGPIEINLTRKRNLNIEEIEKLNEEQIDGTKEKMLNYYNSITYGKFNLSSLDDRENKVCRYCDFRSFCRMQEVFDT